MATICYFFPLDYTFAVDRCYYFNSIIELTECSAIFCHLHYTYISIVANVLYILSWYKCKIIYLKESLHYEQIMKNTVNYMI